MSDFQKGDRSFWPFTPEETKAMLDHPQPKFKMCDRVFYLDPDHTGFVALSRPIVGDERFKGEFESLVEFHGSNRSDWIPDRALTKVAEPGPKFSIGHLRELRKSWQDAPYYRRYEQEGSDRAAEPQWRSMETAPKQELLYVIAKGWYLRQDGTREEFGVSRIHWYKTRWDDDWGATFEPIGWMPWPTAEEPA